MPDRMSEGMPDGMSDARYARSIMSENMTDRMPEDMPDRMSNRMPEDLPDRMSDGFGGAMGATEKKQTPARIPNPQVGICCHQCSRLIHQSDCY